MVKTMKNKLIDLKTLKSALAVAIAIGLAQLMKFEYPFFAGMTALISMDATALLSIKMARNRIVGTMLGALIGVCLATFLWQGSALLCGLGVIILSAICHKLDLKGAIGIGGIVMFAIMVHTDRTPMFYAVNRTATTILGGVIAVIVNISIFPLANVRHLNDMLVKIWHTAEKLIDSIKETEEAQLEEIHAELVELETQLAIYKGEAIFKRGREIVDRCNRELLALRELFVEADVLKKVDAEQYPEVYKYHWERIHELYKSSFNSFE